MKFKINDIDIASILLSGACFRVIKEDDGSFTNILKDRVINIKQDGCYVYVKSNNYDNLEKVIRDYFDLDRNYEKINMELIKSDDSIRTMINKCRTYRILNQDSFEMCISYIISQNNNVKRISKSVEELCKKYGEKIVFEDKEYYLFPTYDKLKNLGVEDFRVLGVGFRDKYLVDFLNKYETLLDIDNLSTKDALEKLMSVKGIGLKVASCILLFGYKRLDVYPIDTWVKHYMTENYNIKDDMKTIEQFINNKYGKFGTSYSVYVSFTKKYLIIKKYVANNL